MLKFFYFYLFLIISVHGVALPSKNDAKNPNVCTSDICVNETTQITNYLNVSVDPCENFYEFVCGKYIHDTILPEDKDTEYVLSIAQDQIDKRLRAILSEEIRPNETKTLRLAKTFYQLCMNEDTRNRKGGTSIEIVIR